jgi:hypothetical protein
MSDHLSSSVHLCGLAANRREMLMSPICLINVAEIRDYAATLPDQSAPSWHARLIDWMARLLRGRRG